MEPLNILVTGGGGFLGRAIVRQLLANGHQVAIIGRSAQPDLEALGIECHQGCITQYASIKKAAKGKQAIFHVAAKAGVWGSWHSYYRPNVLGTQNVIRACHENAVPFLIHTSTPSVVCNNQDFTNQNESLPYGQNWLCHYPHTKAIAEKKVLEVNKPGKLRTIAIRPHLIWGKGDPHIVPRIIEKAKNGQLRQIGEGNNLVDITHVKNAAHAHILALNALIKGHEGGKAYFISDGMPVNLWSWIDNLLKKTDTPKITQKISYRKAYAVGAGLEFIYKTLSIANEPRLTRFIAIQLSKNHYFSINAARADLGYSPLINSTSALQEVINDYTQNESIYTPKESLPKN